MKYPYAVKYNGVVYPANTEIEEVKAEPLEKTPEVEEAKTVKKGTKKTAKVDK